jgi:5'-3' exonuclease
MATGHIDFESAPFEAEWQLIKMERDGRIDGIVSTDGDNIILGAQNLYIDVNFGAKTFVHLSRDTVFSAPPSDNKRLQLMLPSHQSTCFYRKLQPSLVAITLIVFLGMDQSQSLPKHFLNTLMLPTNPAFLIALVVLLLPTDS